MAHLKKGSSGHLLKNADGHLVKTCGSAICPADCSGCAGTFTLTISGATGANCDFVNGAWTLTRTDCVWEGEASAPGFLALIDLECVTTAPCSGGTSKAWRITLGELDGIIIAERVSTADCPPLGVYTICSQGTDCGGTITMTLS